MAQVLALGNLLPIVMRIGHTWMFAPLSVRAVERNAVLHGDYSDSATASAISLGLAATRDTNKQCLLSAVK